MKCALDLKIWIITVLALIESADAYCENLNTAEYGYACDDLANAGECIYSSDWMLTNCQKSCDACDGIIPAAGPSVSCYDGTPNCGRWARKGLCHLAYHFMHSLCRKSCNLCECDNFWADEFCEYEKKIGHCDTTEACEWTAINCQKTCGTCHLPHLIDSCKNLKPKDMCEDWAAAGECTVNPVFMLQMCRRTCSKCHIEVLKNVCQSIAGDVNNYCFSTAITQDMQEWTISFWYNFGTVDDLVYTDHPTIISYAVGSWLEANEIVITFRRDQLCLHDSSGWFGCISISNTLIHSLEGWNKYIFTLTASSGSKWFKWFVGDTDHGQLDFTDKTGLYRGGGTLVLFKEQDSILGGFDITQVQVGKIKEFNMWDKVLSKAEREEATCTLFGNVLNMNDFNIVGNPLVNDVVDVC